MKGRYTKDDVQFHTDNGYNPHAAINIKVYSWRWPKLPLDMGSFSDDGGKTFQKVETAMGFTKEYLCDLDPKLVDEYWWMACADGVDMMEDEAKSIFPGREFWVEGRSGGWFVSDFTKEEVEGWDAVMVAKWNKLVKCADAIVEDVPRVMAESIYFNEYMREREEKLDLVPFMAGA